MDENPYHCPERLLDYVIGLMRLRNDTHLARVLGIGAPQISRIRRHRSPLTASVLLRLHDLTGLEIRALRALMGDYRVHMGRSAPWRSPAEAELYAQWKRRPRAR